MFKYEFSHNPYFNRWFSAIGLEVDLLSKKIVTILILIDGFLQYNEEMDELEINKSQSLF